METTSRWACVVTRKKNGRRMRVEEVNDQILDNGSGIARPRTTNEFSADDVLEARVQLIPGAQIWRGKKLYELWAGVHGVLRKLAGLRRRL